MTRRRLVAAFVALALAPVLFLVGGVAFKGGGGVPPSGAAPVVEAGSLTAGSNDLAAGVTALQARLKRLPEDWTAWASLGSAYVAQARVTADPTLFVKADEAFARSLEVRPESNDYALVGQAYLANARHEFASGRDLAEQAVAVDAYDSTAYGVLSDSLLQLGEYDAAFAALQRMLDLRPGVSAFTRASYSFELRGDLEGARATMQRALDAASSPADKAYASYYLGQLAFDTGDLDEAQARFEQGLARYPASFELAVGRARVLAARGEADEAVAAWARAVQRLPQASYLVEFGDYLTSLGRDEEAAEQYAVADAAGLLARESGVVPDVEVAIYDADQGRVEQALAAAEAQYAERRSVHVEDAYAWALHAAGRDTEALEHALAAQRLGTRSALFAYHRGMIQASLGMDAEARVSLSEALAINPYFSPLYAPVAEQELDELGGPV